MPERDTGLSKVVPFKAKEEVRPYPWHCCGMCHNMNMADGMCCLYPEDIPVHPKRFGCDFWQCRVCGNDHINHRRQWLDHSDCLRESTVNVSP